MRSIKTYLTPGILICALLLIAGLAGWGATMVVGQKLFGASNSVPWNVLLSNYAFLALAASGLCLTVALSSIVGNKELKAVAPIALVLAIAALIGGMMNTASELGNPLRIVYVFLTPNLKSPISWIFFIYTIYLPLLCYELYLVLKRKSAGLITGLALLIGLTAPAVLGTIFAQAAGRPLLNGLSMSVYYLLAAMPAGLAFLILAIFITRGTGEQALASARAAGRWLAMSLPFLLVALIWKAATLPNGSLQAIVQFADAYGGRHFWALAPGIAIGLPFLLLLSTYGRRADVLGLSAVFIVAGSFVARHTELIVGQLVPASPLFATGSYTVSPTDAVMVLGWIGLFGLLFQVGVKAFGLDRPGEAPPVEAAAGDD